MLLDVDRPELFKQRTCSTLGLWAVILYITALLVAFPVDFPTHLL